MRSSIEKLEQEIWYCCVMQRAAKDEETVNRWQTDELAHLKERFIVQPMPSELNDLVERALAEWQQIEDKVCSKLGKGRDEFLNEFEKIREDFLNRGSEWRMAINSMRYIVYGAVRNISWVNLFSWMLPKADKERYEKHREVGRMVTAIFYIELLCKYADDYENEYLKRIEARWRLVSEL